jgi:hypothetical protein
LAIFFCYLGLLKWSLTPLTAPKNQAVKKWVKIGQEPIL